MTNVVDLSERRKDPHLSGSAKCLSCEHEWQAVAPVGTFELECPSCNTLKGVWYGMVIPAKDELRFVCNCGNDVFFVLKDNAALCPKCGVVHE